MVEQQHEVEGDLTVEHEHTTHSQGFYLAIGAALLVLTATTVAAAFVNLGPFVIALLIATIKATLVIIFFMHVKGASEKLTGAIVVSGFFFLAILIALSLADYMTRSWR